MPLFFRIVTWVGVYGNSAASPVCAISEILAELAMYSTTLGPTVFGQAVKPGSTLLSVPPFNLLKARKACRPKGDDDSDLKTTLPFSLGSAMSSHDVGGAQPLSA